MKEELCDKRKESTGRGRGKRGARGKKDKTSHFLSYMESVSVDTHTHPQAHTHRTETILEGESSKIRRRAVRKSVEQL